jgi:hypothetical protein
MTNHLRRGADTIGAIMACVVQSPRRNCCRVVSSPKQGKDRSMIIDVGVCRDGDFAKV